MGTSLSKKYDAFETCPSMTNSSRPFQTSQRRCAKSWVTVADCRPGFKTLGPVINMGNGPAYCGAFGNGDEYAGQCYFSDYPMDEENLAKCCSGEYPAEHCAKGYCWKSKTCKSHMRNFCNKGNNWENKQCKQHFSAFPNEEKIMLREKCNNDINMKKSSTCRTFCNDNPGECDIWINRFCSNNPDDDMCACINSELSTLAGGAVAPAECFDPKCKAMGYRTRAMQKVVKGGCKLININCNAIISASEDSNIVNATINQECSAEIAERGAKNTYIKKNTPHVSNQPKITENVSKGTIKRTLKTPIVKKLDLTFIKEPYYSSIENITIGDCIIVMLFILLISVVSWRMLYATKNPKLNTAVQLDTRI
jgi:hypothetical protein